VTTCQALSSNERERVKATVCDDIIVSHALLKRARDCHPAKNGNGSGADGSTAVCSLGTIQHLHAQYLPLDRCDVMPVRKGAYRAVQGKGAYRAVHNKAAA
jgi:hypothetical protein